MDSRQRFLRTFSGEKVPPPEWQCFGFQRSTIERWRLEGLPDDMPVEDYFSVAPRMIMPVNSGFYGIPYHPPFQEEVLLEDDESRIWRDGWGYIKRRWKGRPEPSMTHYLGYPVKCRKDWEEIKWRLDPMEPARYPDWAEMHCQYDNRNNVIALNICGAYAFPMNMFDVMPLAYAYNDDPDLIHDIMVHWLRFYQELTSRVLSNFIPDYICIWEGLGFSNGPFISPMMFKDFISPYYAELISHVKRLGVEIIIVDSDGDIRPILNLLLDAGVNGFLTCEILANMEPLELRQRFGDDFLIIGGIDHRVLNEDFEAIKHEVMRKVPLLLERGKYIPMLDYYCTPDIPLRNYRYYVELCAIYAVYVSLSVESFNPFNP